MLSSMFALLAVTAVVLLVPAFAALLAVERHRHVAPGEDVRRRVRVVVAATVVALAALGVAALLRAGAISAFVVAVVLAGSVLVWAPMSRSWAVRGVVMWALLVTAAVGVLGWLVQQIVASSMSGTEIAVTGAVSLILLLAMARGQGYVRDVIAAQTGLGPPNVARQRMPVLRPLVSLAVLLAAGSAVMAVTSGDPGPTTGGSPQAGRSEKGIAPSPPQPSTASTPTLSGSPLKPNAGRTPAANPRGGAGGGVPVTSAGGAPSLGTAGNTAQPVARAAGQPTSPRTGTGSGTTPAAARTPAARPTRHATPKPTANPWDGVDWDDPPPDEPSGGSTTYPKPTPAPPSTRPPSPPPPPPPPVQAAKTPGYAKYKPNRPAGAPSPGHGRQNRRQEIVPPYATLPKHPLR